MKKLNRLYIFVPVWKNTANNHAGMYYLAREIERRTPFEVKIIKIPTGHLRLLFWAYRLYIDLIAFWLRFTLRDGDAVWLLEYYLRTIQMSDAAHILRGKTTVLATAHLVPATVSSHYSLATIRRKAKPLDRLYTLGSSLSRFYQSAGVDTAKIKTSFHYADTDFYQPSPHTPGKRLTAIAMGNMSRDNNMLREIIRLSPDVDFIICTGMRPTKIFRDLDNVQVYGFLPEEELRDLMHRADVSINPMIDTVGSNVITTSLACGLPVVASDVGSIRDYVEPEVTGLLFADVQQGADALRRLSDDRALLRRLGENAREKALSISIDRYIDHLVDDINSIQTHAPEAPR